MQNTGETVTVVTEATEAVEAPETAAEGTEGTGVAEGTATDAEAALETLRAEFDGFKRRVAEVTAKYAKRHDMCGVVDTALSEIGLRRPVQTNRVEVTLKLSYTAEVASGNRSAAYRDRDAWQAVHNIAYSLRTNTVDGVMDGFANTDATRGLVIETAEVVITPSDTADAHLLPGGPVGLCPTCDAILRADGRCSNSYC